MQDVSIFLVHCQRQAQSLQEEGMIRLLAGLQIRNSQDFVLVRLKLEMLLCDNRRKT